MDMTRAPFDLIISERVFYLQPPSHSRFVRGIGFPKPFLKISLYVLDDKFIAKQNKDGGKDHSPVCTKIKWDPNNHQKESEVDWIARETINSRSYDIRYWMIGI